MPDWKALSQKKEESTAISSELWFGLIKNTRTSFRDSELKDPELEALVSASESIECLQTFLNRYYESLRQKPDPQVLRSFFDSINQSPYPLSEWLEAYQALSQWLSSHALKASFRDQTAYLACCSSASGATPLLEFLEEMLSLYGFERANPEKTARD